MEPSLPSYRCVYACARVGAKKTDVIAVLQMDEESHACVQMHTCLRLSLYFFVIVSAMPPSTQNARARLHYD